MKHGKKAPITCTTTGLIIGMSVLIWMWMSQLIWMPFTKWFIYMKPYRCLSKIHFGSKKTNQIRYIAWKYYQIIIDAMKTMANLHGKKYRFSRCKFVTVLVEKFCNTFMFCYTMLSRFFVFCLYMYYNKPSCTIAKWFTDTIQPSAASTS